MAVKEEEGRRAGVREEGWTGEVREGYTKDGLENRAQRKRDEGRRG